MSQTVVGLFDDRSHAEEAIRKLEASGITRENIDVSRGHLRPQGAQAPGSASDTVNPVSGSERDENSVARTADDRTVDADGRNTNIFTDFFNNLFGSGNKDSERYSHVASKAAAMVTVHAATIEQAGKAADILDDCGAVNVDEKAATYGYNSGVAGTSPQDTPATDANGYRNLDTGTTRIRSKIFERKIEPAQRVRNNDLEDDGA